MRLTAQRKTILLIGYHSRLIKRRSVVYGMLGTDAERDSFSNPSSLANLVVQQPSCVPARKRDMIGRLWGIVAEVGEEEALIDVGGVGYLVRCGSRTLARLPSVGETTNLHIESQWGEQTGMTLYGFLDRNERRAFVMLKTIQGVGPKAALSVLDVLPPSELSSAAQRGDQAAVARAQGVGAKLALRIVTELKDKPIGDGAVAAFHASATPAKASATGEAVAALMGLGVAEPAARRVVEQAALRMGDGVEAAVLIKAALQELGR